MSYLPYVFKIQYLGHLLTFYAQPRHCLLLNIFTNQKITERAIPTLPMLSNINGIEGAILQEPTHQ